MHVLRSFPCRKLTAAPDEDEDDDDKLAEDEDDDDKLTRDKNDDKLASIEFGYQRRGEEKRHTKPFNTILLPRYVIFVSRLS